jgi:hypothetical protein
LGGLPANVATVLTNFLDEARDALHEELVSALPFGSAAESRLTVTSDSLSALRQLRSPPYPARNSRIASSRSNR